MAKGLLNLLWALQVPVAAERASLPGFIFPDALIAPAPMRQASGAEELLEALLEEQVALSAPRAPAPALQPISQADVSQLVTPSSQLTNSGSSSLLSVHSAGGSKSATAAKTASKVEWPKREEGSIESADHAWNSMIEIAMEVNSQLNKRISASAYAATQAAKAYKDKREALLKGLDDFNKGMEKLKVHLGEEYLEEVAKIKEYVADGEKQTLMALAKKAVPARHDTVPTAREEGLSQTGGVPDGYAGEMVSDPNLKVASQPK